MGVVEVRMEKLEVRNGDGMRYSYEAEVGGSVFRGSGSWAPVFSFPQRGVFENLMEAIQFAVTMDALFAVGAGRAEVDRYAGLMEVAALGEHGLRLEVTSRRPTWEEREVRVEGEVMYETWRVGWCKGGAGWKVRGEK